MESAASLQGDHLFDAASQERCRPSRRPMPDLSRTLDSLRLEPSFRCKEIMDTAYFGLKLWPCDGSLDPRAPSELNACPLENLLPHAHGFHDDPFRLVVWGSVR